MAVNMVVPNIDAEPAEVDFVPIAEGELGTYLVSIDGQIISHVQLLADLFRLVASQPNLMHATKMPEGKNFVHVQGDLLGDIQEMLDQLDSPNELKKPAAESKISQMAQKPEIHRSLFSLARAMSPNRSPQNEKPQEIKQTHCSPFQPAFHKETERNKTRINKETNLRVEEREAGGGQKGQSGDKQRKDQGYNVKKSDKNESATVESIDNIYIRFLALMARILGQAEAEAHQLYLKIKERTDNIDILSLIVAKINNSPGDIDWSQDPKMRELIDRAREIGVELPEGKYAWSEAEKHLLKENIAMRKDSMEKITQLERTDMQRYLQEASQCHQARSNVLKLLKEVIDTIIHNMRP